MAYNEPNSDGQFVFICAQQPGDRTAKRLARSHAVAQGLENKRKYRQKMGLNFHAISLKSDVRRPTKKRKRNQALIGSECSLSSSAPSEFQILTAESPRLQELLTRHKIQDATEPVFTISDELVLQNLCSVFRKDVKEGAFSSAIMLTFAFALTAGKIDRECLQYQGEALSFIRQGISSPGEAIMESTLGAIILLAGIEARLGMPRQVQLHMGAIQQILDICQRKSVYLSDGIKRAIFWSDLNCSVMSGSSRVVDHTTFSELQWKRDPFSPSSFVLPSGFQAQSHLLGEEFVEVLKDVFALQCIRDSALFGIEDAISMAHVDSHQASIQSRLVSLRNHSSISECCHLAAYLCSTMLRCKKWRTSTIPSHFSSQLLYKLQQVKGDLIWNNSPDLLIWLLYIGGAFAPTGNIRSGYMLPLHSNHNARLGGLYTSWPELLEILKRFIWSEKAFESQVKEFWEELGNPI